MSGLGGKITVVEVALPGFDGGTDATDDKVIWIGTRSDRVLQALERYGKVEVTDIDPDSTGVDFFAHTVEELDSELRSRGIEAKAVAPADTLLSTPTASVEDEFEAMLEANSVPSDVAQELRDLAIKYTKLCEIKSLGELSEEQEEARANLRAMITDRVEGQEGLTAVEFGSDPRYATVKLTLLNERSNVFGGGWSVPVSQEQLDELDGESFWDDYLDAAMPASSAGTNGPEEAGGPGRWIVLSIDETGNAAFVDVGREHEVARIIADAAEKVRNAPGSRDIEIVLADLNGNRVGRLFTTNVEPTGALEPATVRLVIEDTDHVLSRPDHHEHLAQLLEKVSARAEKGDRSFSVSSLVPEEGVKVKAAFEFSKLPTPEQEGRIDMAAALRGTIYMADGVEEGEYRYVIPKGDFEIGYHEDYGDVWLVNAKGEIAYGYEDTQSVRENCMRELTAHERRALTDVVQHRVSFEDHERALGNEDYLDESPEI